MFGIDVTPYDKKIWEEELRDFLPDKIFDAHMHIWEPGTRKVGQKGCVTWTSLVAPDMTYENMVETYAKVFPGKKVKQVLMSSPSCNLELGNGYAIKCAKEHGHPALYCTNWDSDEAEIFAAFKKGFCGIKPYQNNSPSYIPAAEVRIFDFLTPRQLEFMNNIHGIVMLHISRNLRLRDPINLAQLMEIDEKYPNAKVIVAHVGRAYIPSDVGDAFEILKHSKNLYFDFSANTSDYAMQKLFESISSDRILFGTDMPISKMRMYRIEENGTYMNVVPRGLYGDVSNDPHMKESDEENITTFVYEELLAFKRAANAVGYTRDDVEKLMYKNAEKLFDCKI